jgi:nitrite reductase (NADH) small subunit
MPEQRYFVASTGEISAGERKVVEVAEKSIGVFNVNGEYVAVLNLCPHEYAPICLGRVDGTTLPGQPGEYIWGREGEILHCPWHGWEFDLLSGDCLTDRRRLQRFPVEIEDDRVYIRVRTRS